MVNEIAEGVANLSQVVGRDVGGHAHGDAGGAVDQEVGEQGGQDHGLSQGFVKVGGVVHCVSIQVCQELLSDGARRASV